MLSEKVVYHCKQRGWWFDEVTQEYVSALQQIGVDPESDFALFYLHAEDGPTFVGRNHREMYQICWFVVNSNSYIMSIQGRQEGLNLPPEYIPLDSFEGEYGYFYHRSTGQVLGLGLGEEWHRFMDGTLQPQWQDFNAFLEWFWELEE
ncbi:hypothetical protein [Paenibacillus bovis]|uniref:SMI1/KNR4 family protein n=1 Tax=Paenibacillus bovis TaxID=1616788 RepID=A0A172ZBF4_9BACL|nr:hypothetical protein [Paenibacillus bovis]ANF94587.1 hypothetical protein AR543_00095 [Paenibacillus bovis]